MAVGHPGVSSQIKVRMPTKTFQWQVRAFLPKAPILPFLLTHDRWVGRKGARPARGPHMKQRADMAAASVFRCLQGKPCACSPHPCSYLGTCPFAQGEQEEASIKTREKQNEEYAAGSLEACCGNSRPLTLVPTETGSRSRQGGPSPPVTRPPQVLSVKLGVKMHAVNPPPPQKKKTDPIKRREK